MSPSPPAKANTVGTTQARIELGGQLHDVAVARMEAGWRIEVDGDQFEVRRLNNGDAAAFEVSCVSAPRADGRGAVHHVRLGPGRATVDGKENAYRVVSLAGGAGASGAGKGGALRVKPPMIGRIESMRVKAGDVVEKGQVLFVLEAMKMHNEVKSPASGTVQAVHAKPGDAVDVAHAVVEIQT
jgi:biotin carboxyl carrier protein